MYVKISTEMVEINKENAALKTMIFVKKVPSDL